MKFFSLSLFAIIVGVSAMAQKTVEKKLHFSLGAEIGFATGGFSNNHSIGTGISGQASYRIADATDLTFTTGYLTYAGKSSGVGTKFKPTGIIPFKAGLKYYVTEGFYGQAQLGFAVVNNFAYISNNVTTNTNGSAFAYSPLIIGYEFNTKQGQALDASIKYDGYLVQGGNIGTVNLRLAYKF